MQLSFLSLIYFIGFSHAVLMTLALWRQTKQGQSGRILAVLLSVLAYKMLEGGVTYSSLYQIMPHILDLMPGAVLLMGPIFYGYIRAVSGEMPFTTKQWMLHLSPFILLFVVNSPQVFVPAIEKVTSITQRQAFNEPMVLPWRIVILLIIIKVHLATYLAHAWKILKTFEHQVKQLRADSSQFVLGRHKQLCLSFIALEALWVILFVLQQTAGIYALDYVGKSWLVFMAIIILAIGYYGLKQPNILFSEAERLLVFNNLDTDISKPSAPQQKYTTIEHSSLQSNENNSILQPKESTEQNHKYHLSKIPESTAQEIVSNIGNILATKALYLDDKLTLTRLADELTLKPHLVSQVINQTMKTSFYKLINQYRVKHAITLLEKHDSTWSIERIAFESGFGNRVTFNNAFKTFKGCSPSAFKKQIKMAS